MKAKTIHYYYTECRAQRMAYKNVFLVSLELDKVTCGHCLTETRRGMNKRDKPNEKANVSYQ